MPTPTLLDLRAEQTNPPKLVRGERKHLVRNGSVVVRDPKTIDTICVHQTACFFGPANDPTAKHRRALDVACHALGFQDGTVALPNPLHWYVWHGNGFNSRSLGFEFEGVFPGLRKQRLLSPLALETARFGIHELVRLGREGGCPIQFIVAHRQSSSSRRSDPGQEFWEDVVLAYAVKVLGLVPIQSLKMGGGRPIPKEWDKEGGVGAF
jgi:hypothetical protein